MKKKSSIILATFITLACYLCLFVGCEEGFLNSGISIKHPTEDINLWNNDHTLSNYEFNEVKII